MSKPKPTRACYIFIWPFSLNGAATVAAPINGPCITVSIFLIVEILLKNLSNFFRFLNILFFRRIIEPRAFVFYCCFWKRKFTFFSRYRRVRKHREFFCEWMKGEKAQSEKRAQSRRAAQQRAQAATSKTSNPRAARLSQEGAPVITSSDKGNWEALKCENTEFRSIKIRNFCIKI